MLLFVSSIKLIAEIALLALLGQGALYVLAGAKRETNVFYRLLKVMTNPFIRAARLLSPRLVLDRHVPLVAFALMACVWIAATIYKIQLCLETGVQACR